MLEQSKGSVMQLPELVVSFLILKYFSVLHDVHASSSSPVMQSKQVEWHYSLQIFVEADERYPVGQDAMHVLPVKVL